MLPGLKLSLIGFIFLCASLTTHAQKIQVESSKRNPAYFHYKELIRKKIYLSGQLRKDYVPTRLKNFYKQSLEQIDKELNAIHSLPDSLLGLQELKERTLLKTDAEIMDLIPPLTHTYEPGAWVFMGSVSYAGQSLSLPLRLEALYGAYEKVSVGAYFTYFKENFLSSQTLPQTSQSFSVNRSNYHYNYWGLGGTVIYHFLDPVNDFLLNPEIFDFYLVGRLGINIPSSPASELKNGLIDQKAGYKGLDGGVWIGLRYQFIDNLAFLAEAGYGRTGSLTLGLSYNFIPVSLKHINK